MGKIPEQGALVRTKIHSEIAGTEWFYSVVLTGKARMMVAVVDTEPHVRVQTGDDVRWSPVSELETVDPPRPPACGFGKEQTPKEIRARIERELWCENLQRAMGQNALADGHALTAAAYRERLTECVCKGCA